MLRYLNMFVLIGLALIGISIAGFATGNNFLHEPGQATDPKAALIYLGAGALMLINGYLSIRNAPPHSSSPQQAQEPRQDGSDTSRSGDSSEISFGA